VEISGQEQVANLPLREGLEAASQLVMGLPPEINDASLAADLPATMQAAPPTGDVPAEGSLPSPAEQNPQTPTNPVPTASSASTSNQDPTTALGTGLIPRTPELTAQQIAGHQAMDRARQTLALAPPQPASASGIQAASTASGSEAGQQQTDTPGLAAPSSATETAATSGDTSNSRSDASQSQGSEPRNPSDNQAADSLSDADVRARLLRDEAWFAKLPPSLREAIEARTRRRPPRGYEERLRRYFESVD
jgi:hypothetical protein